MGTDYCIVAFAIILAISIFQWIVDGRKNYIGPRTDIAVAEPSSTPKDDVTQMVEHRA